MIADTKLIAQLRSNQGTLGREIGKSLAIIESLRVENAGLKEQVMLLRKKLFELDPQLELFAAEDF